MFALCMTKQYCAWGGESQSLVLVLQIPSNAAILVRDLELQKPPWRDNREKKNSAECSEQLISNRIALTRFFFYIKAHVLYKPILMCN